MEKKSKTQYSWYPEGGNCPGVFDSKKDAMSDAQQKYDEQREDFECADEVSSIIHVGPVRFFDMENAVKEIIENIEDIMDDQVHDFSFGCNFESECYVSKKDKEEFIKEAVEALLPIVEKYVYISPQWICTPAVKYDLKNKKWIGFYESSSIIK
jgi:hypothetical protein